MADMQIERHYEVRSLDFRDFWDICGHFHHAHPKLPDVRYSVEGIHDTIAEKETDTGEILRRLQAEPDGILYYQAELTDVVAGAWQRAVLTYRPRPMEGAQVGLHLESPGMNKLRLHQFEEVLIEQYGLQQDEPDVIEFGRPCEILAAVLDMRGFSSFCEQPNIESPYICGLMFSFYKMAVRGFNRYPAEMVKFTGDGLVAVWETTHEDRDMAIQSCLNGVVPLDGQWQEVRNLPQFSHGAPESIGIGISFGLGSALPHTTDYIGRPINVAARLCNACPGGEVLVDKSVPNLDPQYPKQDSSVHVKSFGRYYVWRLQGD